MGRPAGQTDRARSEQHRGGQHLQVQSRDGQQVRRTGPRKGVVDFGLDPLALAQQEGGGQRLDRRVEPVDQVRPAPGPEPPHRFDERSGSTLGIAV